MKYKRAKMVNWFEPAVLLQSGLKSIVSKLFGNYADRRETQAALNDPITIDAWEKQMEEYTQNDEIWIDFISDTGDGFNSTYSVALLAAQKELQFDTDEGKLILPQAKILIMGGDQIYPTPTGELYDEKFKVPFKAALPQDDTDTNPPHMYAIPGNHDWYDGLGSFLKVFCQQRSIGNWKTFQTRSYFALPLPGNYWLWATDVQLNEDIDKPQLNYFRDVAVKKMKAGDKVILCTAEPSWVYKQMYVNDESYERLQFFIKNYITEDKSNTIGKTFQLAVVITGDLHHYAHYCKEDTSGCSNHYIGAGGGGAFLHLTHNLPDKLDKPDEKDIIMKVCYPDKTESKALLSRNIFFPFYNWFFSFLIGLLSLLFFWFLESYMPPIEGRSYIQQIGALSFIDFIVYTAKRLAFLPSLSLLSAIFVFGFFKFTDTKTGIKGIGILGLLHGLLQVSCILLLIWLLGIVHHEQLNPQVTWWLWSIVPIELLVLSSFCGGCLMGIYLLVSDIIFKIHIDESSSALKNEDYKSFLRINISNNTLTIYPIGIKEVTKNWQQEEKDDKLSFIGEIPKHHLIEKPIIIKLN